MRIFWAVVKNDFSRMLAHKSRIVMLLFFTAGAIVAAVFFHTKAETVGNIAFVLQGEESVFESPYANITVLEKEPPMSELVTGRYDAVVTKNTDGEYKIQTVKGDAFQETVAALLSNPQEFSPDHTSHRKAGTNILGFLVMFTMMQSTTLMYLFAEEKEQGQLRRLAASPVSFTGYLCAHSLFAFLFMLIPTMVILYIVKWALGVSIGLGFWGFLLLLSLLCAFAVSFALLLNSLISKRDSASMLGSAVSILTSVLAGSFYSFDKGNPVLEALIKGLPQKSYLTLSNALETGTGMKEWLPHLIYILGFTLVFFLISVVKIRKEYVEN